MRVVLIKNEVKSGYRGKILVMIENRFESIKSKTYICKRFLNEKEKQNTVRTYERNMIESFNF